MLSGLCNRAAHSASYRLVDLEARVVPRLAPALAIRHQVPPRNPADYVPACTVHRARLTH